MSWGQEGHPWGQEGTPSVHQMSQGEERHPGDTPMPWGQEGHPWGQEEDTHGWGHPRDTKCHGDGDSRDTHRDTHRDTPYLGDIRDTLGDKRGHQMPWG